MAADLDAIKESMEMGGFDASKPLDVWRQENVLLDGHTRLSAAAAAGVDVTVYYHDFDTEGAALEYAVNNQSRRRNMTDADIVRCVAALDKRRDMRETLKQNVTASSLELAVTGPTRDTTAEVVGTSPRKVEQVRTVLDHADEETRAAVLQGDMSINKAYRQTQDARSQKAEEVFTPAERPSGRAFG